MFAPLTHPSPPPGQAGLSLLRPPAQPASRFLAAQNPLLILSLQITPSFLEGLRDPPLGSVPSGHPFRPSVGSAYLL